MDTHRPEYAGHDHRNRLLTRLQLFIRVHLRSFAVPLLMLACRPAYAATHYVNAANPTPAAPYTNWATASTNIQYAINAAAPAGLVLVTNGTYTGPGKSVSPYGLTMFGVTNGVTLRSVNGPEVTILDGQGNKRGVIMSNAVVEGFTIANCVGAGFLTYKGGGGALVGGGGRLIRCILTGNRGDNYGGGAAVFSLGLISNCVIRGNTAKTAGGGVCMYEGGLVVDCVISNNLVGGTTGARGGGIACEVGGVVSNCLIVNNTSYIQGGGISIFTNGLAANCLVAGNIANSNNAEGEGGGAYLHQGGTLLNCVLSNNYGLWQGGAVKFYYGGGLVRGCLMRDNRTLGWGGAMMMRSGGRAENCTIVNNTAGEGGGVYFYLLGGTNFNSIIYHNTGGDLTNAYAGSTLYSCVPQDGLGAGNLTNEPAFVDLAGGDLRLSTNSPCINRGTNQAWMSGAGDLVGNPRIQNDLVDMGAFESPFWSRYEDADEDWLSDGDEEAQGTLRLDPDTDKDGQMDGQEVFTGTQPTNALSCFRVISQAEQSAEYPVLRWGSIADRTYRMERSGHLESNDFTVIQANIPADPPMNTETDATAASDGPWFYRVVAQ